MCCSAAWWRPPGCRSSKRCCWWPPHSSSSLLCGRLMDSHCPVSCRTSWRIRKCRRGWLTLLGDPAKIDVGGRARARDSSNRACTSRHRSIRSAWGMALVFGTAGLPHILMRFFTVRSAQQARKSVVWAMVIIGGFYLLTLFLGFGAAKLVGPGRHCRRSMPAATWRRRCWRSTLAAARTPSSAISCWHSFRRWLLPPSSRW